jgi:hypothetical protein
LNDGAVVAPEYLEKRPHYCLIFLAGQDYWVRRIEINRRAGMPPWWYLNASFPRLVATEGDITNQHIGFEVLDDFLRIPDAHQKPQHGFVNQVAQRLCDSLATPYNAH